MTARSTLISIVRAWCEQHPGYPETAEAIVEAFEVEAQCRAVAALRAWGEEGAMRLAEDEDGTPLHRSPFYMWEDADRAADLIEELICVIDPGRTCDCGEPACECGCQQGERGRHWIHSRSCGTQKGSQ